MVDSGGSAGGSARRVLVVAGPPGAGKSTVARLVADRREAPSVCLESDWFWTTIARGFIAPWEPASDAQNRTVLRAVGAAAAELALGGYSVALDGVIGPWNLPVLVEALDTRDVAVDYVALRPTLGTCLARAAGRAGETPRVPGNPPLTDSGPIRALWSQFADLGPYERHALDTTALTADQTADRILGSLADGTLRLHPEA